MPKLTGRSGPLPAMRRYVIRYFRGLDLANPPEKADPSRSCGGKNMIRDVPGKVKKRTGYERVRRYDGRINGLFSYRGQLLVHAGTKLYLDGETPKETGSGLADQRSDAKPLGGCLWIADGLRLLRYDGETVRAAEEIAYTPTITVSRAPDGGGTPYEAVNLLGSRCRESFLGAEGARVYQLSRAGLSAGEVKARKRNAGGGWTELSEGKDFSADRALGKLTFAAPPGAPPVTGEDNLEIEYEKESAENRNKVNRCRFGICYGSQGAPDRLFLSGNPDLPNYDFHSALDNPGYFGEDRYGVIGQSHSPIMGYSVIGDALATHKREDDDGRNIFLRKGTGEREGASGEQADAARFPISGMIQGAGAISRHAYGFLGEPIFLTALGIASAAPREWNGERYVQNRGFFLNRALLAEDGLEEAVAAAYRDFYLLAVNGKVYVLDTLAGESGASGNAAQYEGYLFDNVPARVLANIGERLWFGTEHGSLMRFYQDADAPESYSDANDASEGTVPIDARWDFDFSGTLFYKRKHIRYIAVRIAPYAATSLTATAATGKEERLLLGGGSRMFSFSRLCFSDIRFSSADALETIGTRVRISSTDSVRFRFRNREMNEPLGLHEIAVEYYEGAGSAR